MTANPYDPPSTESQGQLGPPVQWHGSLLDVHARLVSRFLWTTASIDVHLDGTPILRSGGQFKIAGSCHSEFMHNGLSHTCELTWDTGKLGRFPYTLSVDGEQILRSTVRIVNWPMLLVPSLIISLFLLGLLVGLSYFAFPVPRP
ncbi:MAG: hypothetical protein H8E44_11480 [Planctomycetes bacterium]|nr:hypothetical protein [Planctomycetota bacterium]MBL7038522.1 hypothetical protein [Pirellulaceae bacterium]